MLSGVWCTAWRIGIRGTAIWTMCVLVCRPAPTELGIDRVKNMHGQLQSVKYGGLPAMIAQMDGVQHKVDGMLATERGINEAVKTYQYSSLVEYGLL